eukprot:1158870-Rhodomonas_salina.2
MECGGGAQGDDEYVWLPWRCRLESMGESEIRDWWSRAGNPRSAPIYTLSSIRSKPRVSQNQIQAPTFPGHHVQSVSDIPQCTTSYLQTLCALCRDCGSPLVSHVASCEPARRCP